VNLHCGRWRSDLDQYAVVFLHVNSNSVLGVSVFRVSGHGDYVSGQPRQGSCLSPACPDIPADTHGRDLSFSWVSGHPTNVSGHGSG
jgi:hypothetical protein